MVDFSDLKLPYLIAEIGINHNGNMKIAKQIMDVASASRFSAVKFQKRTPELCVPKEMWDVEKDTPWGTMPYIEYKRLIEFNVTEYAELYRYAKDKPIDFSASVWDIESVEFMAQFDIPFIKIPSAHLTNHELIRCACTLDVPVIVSTGMSTIEEVDAAVAVLDERGVQYVIMHCHSGYPAPTNELNLRVIQTFIKRYPNAACIGYSGHEYGIATSVVAAALGAKVIERHVTTDRSMWGSDQLSSLEPAGADKLQRHIREVESSLGDGVKRVWASELSKRKSLRGY